MDYDILQRQIVVAYLKNPGFFDWNPGDHFEIIKFFCETYQDQLRKEPPHFRQDVLIKCMQALERACDEILNDKEDYFSVIPEYMKQDFSNHSILHMCSGKIICLCMLKIA